MTALFQAQVFLLLQRVPALSDTVYTKDVSELTAFQTVTSVASGLMSVALLVLTVFLVPAAWNFRKSYEKINKLLERVYGDINPIVRHVSTISDNVDYITTSIRVDVQQVNRTIAEANQRLNHALALSEQRLNEFNALLQVVQREAEGAFVAAAATVRGVRVGAETFQSEALAGSAPPFTDPDYEEFYDGDDDYPTETFRESRPRIRPRTRG